MSSLMSWGYCGVIKGPDRSSLMVILQSAMQRILCGFRAEISDMSLIPCVFLTKLGLGLAPLNGVLKFAPKKIVFTTQIHKVFCCAYIEWIFPYGKNLLPEQPPRIPPCSPLPLLRSPAALVYTPV